MFDAEGTVIAANRLAAHFCGLLPEVFTRGANIRELWTMQLALGVHGDEASAARFLASRANEPLKGPDRYRRINPDGTVVEIITDRLPEGGYVRSFIDITAQGAGRGRGDQLGRRCCKPYSANMRHGIILYDADGYVRTGNALGARLAGLPVERLKPGAHFDDLRDSRPCRVSMARVTPRRWMTNCAREPWKGESTYTRKRPDGSIIEVRTDLIPGGGCVRSFTDITALTEAQAAAASRAAVVQAMLDNMRHGIVMFDANFMMVTANPLASELLGLRGWLKPGVSYNDDAG